MHSLTLTVASQTLCYFLLEYRQPASCITAIDKGFYFSLFADQACEREGNWNWVLL